MMSTEYRVIKQNAKAYDHPGDTSVHFWISQDAIVFADDNRLPQDEYIPVIVRAEYQVWMSRATLKEVLPNNPLT